MFDSAPGSPDRISLWGWRTAYPFRIHPVDPEKANRTRNYIPHSAKQRRSGCHSIQRVSTSTSAVINNHSSCFTMAPVVARQLYSGHLRPFGCCRPPIQSRRRSRPPSSSDPTQMGRTSFGSSVYHLLHSALAGLTMTNASDHLGQSFLSATQKARSVLVNFGRLVERVITASC